ncbi:LysR family transcriptional regulator [Roseomonas sp. E05]|uniref:LysR family transcriptional regulator n=1 Tax=Roseomonas sp. E05 TaxID=3046310 RepID=UPI0024BBA2E8|nr:LysR family transcriptional regulator [Roseomonas sp. E05]MDJ0391182.1 LysR family transcriptional regulator [Roseomonas sp. E05]
MTPPSKSLDASMDLRQLECFLCLYEEGSVTRAARRLNIVQPALSMRIARLETELDQKLFERSPQGMRPTPDGHRAYELFAPVLASFREAQSKLARRGPGGTGRLAAGFVSTAADSVLASSMARFIARFPDAEITAFEGYSTLLYDWVRAGLLDFAVVNDIAEDPELQSLPLIDEPFLLIGAAGTALGEGPLPPHALQELRLVLPTKRHGLRVTIDRALEREKLGLAIRLEVDALGAIGQLVAEPGWFTLLPATALSEGLRAGRLRSWRVAMPGLRRRLVCAYGVRRPLRPAGHRFIELLREELQNLAKHLVPGEAASPKGGETHP